MSDLLRYRAKEDRDLKGGKTVVADEVFDVPDDEYGRGLRDQPYFEEITPAKRPTKESE